MKKIICIFFAILMTVSIAGCGTNENTATAGNQKTDSAQESSKAEISSDIQVDLTKLSSTIVYSEVYNMLNNPSDYIGKKVKMSGQFALYYAYDENDQPILDQYYFTCVIKDATACCKQGLEFILAGDYKYPEDYPKLGTDITVTGEFQSYMEGKDRYFHLVDAVLE